LDIKISQIFEKTINRIENGVIPNSETDILTVENDLIVYINT
jgi:hypothetical protein